MSRNNLHRNGSGCYDPVACVAISKIDKEDARFQKFLDTIFNLAELSGYHIEERIVVKDKKTGRIWR